MVHPSKQLEYENAILDRECFRKKNSAPHHDFFNGCDDLFETSLKVHQGDLDTHSGGS